MLPHNKQRNVIYLFLLNIQRQIIMNHMCWLSHCSISVTFCPMSTAAVKHARCVFKTCINSSDICSFNMSQHIVNVLIRAPQWACRQLSERQRLKGHERQDKPGTTGRMDAESKEQIQTCLQFMRRCVSVFQALGLAGCWDGKEAL